MSDTSHRRRIFNSTNAALRAELQFSTPEVKNFANLYLSQLHAALSKQPELVPLILQTFSPPPWASI
jgi:hypothetical protein